MRKERRKSISLAWTTILKYRQLKLDFIIRWARRQWDFSLQPMFMNGNQIKIFREWNKCIKRQKDCKASLALYLQQVFLKPFCFLINSLNLNQTNLEKHGNRGQVLIKWCSYAAAGNVYTIFSKIYGTIWTKPATTLKLTNIRSLYLSG